MCNCKNSNLKRSQEFCLEGLRTEAPYSAEIETLKTSRRKGSVPLRSGLEVLGSVESSASRVRGRTAAENEFWCI